MRPLNEEAHANKLDDFPVHQTPELWHRRQRPQCLRPDLVQRHAADGSYYFGVGMAIYRTGASSTARSAVQPGGRHIASTAHAAPIERTEMQVGPFRLESSSPCADPADPGGQRQRPVLRPDLLSPHRGDQGGAPDSIPAPRDHGFHRFD
jgi:hypothetical protein